MNRPTHLRRRPISRSGKQAVIVQEAPGSYVRGKWTPGAATERTVMVVMEPPSLQETGLLAKVLPEATQLASVLKFYILDDDVAPLRVGDGATGRDLIRYAGTTYRVMRTEPWEGLTGEDTLDHQVVYAVRLDVQP